MLRNDSISVVICTFNRIDWLVRCLEGLGQLELPANEIVVVDGPSTDGTREMLEELRSKGKVILVPQPKLEGISAARNLGLQAVKGDLVCFIDDDAIPYPQWTKAILSGYKDDRVGGVGGPVNNMAGELAMGRNAVSVYGDWADESKGQSVAGMYPVMVGCNMSFKTEVLRQVGGFDPYFRYHQDETDACLRVLLAGYRIEYLEDAIVRHEWCRGSYRKDYMRWYLKLRYMWGRNTAHLVGKNFRGKVDFGEYLAHQVQLAARSRMPTSRGTEGPKARCSERKMPRPIAFMGTAFEVYGAIAGWR
jgi:GT2 family glycosyltransferase